MQALGLVRTYTKKLLKFFLKKIHSECKKNGIGRVGYIKHIIISIYQTKSGTTIKREDI